MADQSSMSNWDSLYTKLDETRKQSRIWTFIRIAALCGLGIIAMLERDPQFHVTIYWTVIVCYELMYALGQKEMFDHIADLSASSQTGPL